MSTPTAFRPLPRSANVGISAISHRGTTAWGLIVEGTHPQTFTGTLAGENRGMGLLAAFEVVNAHETLRRGPVTLFLDSIEHRRMFKEMAQRLPRLTLHSDVGSFGRAARAAALVLVPGFPYAEAPVPRRVTVATDGSCGRAARGPRGVGAGWISDLGRFGHDASSEFRCPLDAELLAIVRAMQSQHRQQPVHIECDSQEAIALVEDLRAGRTPVADRARHILLADLRKCLDTRNATFGWVKGHAANPLNIAADRLAVGARRIHQMRLPAHDFDPIAERIAADYMSGTIAAEVTDLAS